MELYFLILLIVLMAAALGSGYPVAFALPGSAIVTVALAALCGYMFTGDVDAYFADGGPNQWLNAGVTNFRGVYWEVERDTLIAIPLFIFMGIMLQRSRIAEDLLVTMAQLFGPVPGGLGISVIIVGALLAATTGIVGATVVAMGLISLPAMLRNNYSHSLATGTIAASGTLGQIIPPSIVLIILADQLASAADQAGTARKALYKASTGDFIMPSAFDVISTSAGEMFLGALFPGLVLVGLYVLFIAGFALLRPKMAPAVPYDGEYDFKFAGRVLMALVPPLALIVIVLGSIILGIATVNQAGSIGAAGALIMAGYRLFNGKKRAYFPAILAMISLVVILFIAQTNPINIKKVSSAEDYFWMNIAIVAVIGLVGALIWSGARVYKIDNTLREVMIETAKTTSLVFIILLGAAMLTSAFRGFGGEELVKESLTGLPGGFWGQFAIVMLVIFILGFFLDFIEIAVVVVPIVAPILLSDPSANVTAVWLGVMIGLNIQTSFLTPPFGFALFYLRGVAPAVVKTISMYKGVIAFIMLQLVALGIVAYYPKLVNYLPQRVSLTAETAPPPINPALQHCLEKKMFVTYRNQKDSILSAISAVKGLDYSVLPEGLRGDLVGSFGNAEKTFDLVKSAEVAQADLNNKSVSYRPLHVKVREIERDIRILKDEIKELQSNRGGKSDKEIVVIENKVAALREEIKQKQKTIPEEWKTARLAFKKLLTVEKIALAKYRRNVDSAYEPVREVVTIIAAYDQLLGQGIEIDKLESVITSKPPKEAAVQIEELMSVIGSIAGASKVRSALYQVRKALTAREPSTEGALEKLKVAKAEFKKEIDWRKAAHSGLYEKLRDYEMAIRFNIGMRKQPKMPESFATDLAGCTSLHRDLTLRF